MIRYVLGFAFDDTGDNVVLIKKTKPAWQEGKFNGVGGKIESDEGPFHAMVREFYEEAGVMTTADNWTAFGMMHGPDWRCDVFYAFNNFVFTRASTQTEEYVLTFSAHPPFPETISNVPWLIAAARNHHQNNGEFSLDVKYA